ncbi:ATP-binding protein [Kitasatospora sp. SUK 42]|uniref:ATP-binding protein n=1 Tax=Kitasatospora sp. SUK 42 TaxID=1588882 RepID=UPI0018C8F28F|nr:ATP-binding protein [Kitasatospora sp. SUK 42]MBV2154324.1 ATP-binding protein [Kitasatospora sp. SUK 42]
MKQALKAAGTAALGIAIAAIGAGTASAADGQAAGGLGLPTGAVTNPAVTGAVTEAAAKLPGGDKVTSALGALAPTVGRAAPADATPIAGVTEQRGAVPSVPGLDKTPIGGLAGLLPGLPLG